jgi:hypothetical protein
MFETSGNRLKHLLNCVRFSTASDSQLRQTGASVYITYKAAVPAAAQQAEGAMALLVEEPYREEGRHDGFPCYKNVSGMCLYRLQVAEQWYIGSAISPNEPAHDGDATIAAPEGAVPTGKQTWRVLNEVYMVDCTWEEDEVTVRVLTTAEEIDEATARYPVSAMKKAPAARPASRPATPCRSPSRRPAVTIDATPAERGRRDSLAGGGRARGRSSSRARSRSRSRGRPAADGDAANSCAICGRTFPASMCGTGSKR